MEPAIDGPPPAQEWLRRRADGRVLVELRKAWRDGAVHLLVEPAEFLEKLPALPPPPIPDPSQSRGWTRPL